MQVGIIVSAAAAATCYHQMEQTHKKMTDLFANGFATNNYRPLPNQIST